VPARAAAVRVFCCHPLVGFGGNGLPLALTSWCADGPGSRVVEAFGALAHDAAPDEPLQRAQGAVIFRHYEADGVSDRVRAASSVDAVNVILRVHGEVLNHHVRNAVHIDPAGGSGAGWEEYGAGGSAFRDLDGSTKRGR
jgi:hypothetical protein